MFIGKSEAMAAEIWWTNGEIKKAWSDERYGMQDVEYIIFCYALSILLLFLLIVWVPSRMFCCSSFLVMLVEELEVLISAAGDSNVQQTILFQDS